MNSKNPGVAKNAVRAASGGIAVVVALIALLFLRGGSPGSGDEQSGSTESTGTPLATTEPNPSTTSNPKPKPAPNEATTVADPTATGGLTSDEQTALAEDVLGIMIDEYDYFLVVPGKDTIYRPAALSRLLELAEQARGDSNGIRVRIVRRETSRTKAEVDLKTALAGIGIGEDAVYMPAELLPK